MPHDKNGKLLKAGDHVFIEFVVKDVMEAEDFCNVNLETVIPMQPSGTACGMSLNAGQCELIEELAPEKPKEPEALADPEKLEDMDKPPAEEPSPAAEELNPVVEKGPGWEKRKDGTILRVDQ